MKILNLLQLSCATILATSLCAVPRSAHAGGQSFDKEVLQDDGKGYVAEDTGRFSRFPVRVTVSVRGGYDDNVNLDSFDEQESFFTNLAVGLSYEFGSPRTRLSLNATGGVTYYFDRESFDGDDDSYDFYGSLGFSITHKATPRLTLAAAVYAAYQSMPDYAIFTQGTVGLGRQNRDFFFTGNKFSIGYAWTPRFSTVTSYTINYVDYDDDFISTFQDRFEHTFGNEFRFLLAPVTSLVFDYRFGIVDYLDSDVRDSTSHFLLAGVDHSFSPRFTSSVRAGVEFRDFDTEFIGGPRDRTRPYAEGTLRYAISQGTSVSLFSRYAIEQSDIADAFSRQTFRLGLGLRHNFTPRIVAGLNFAYQHDDYDDAFGIEGFDEDAFLITLSARYAINRSWAIDVGYAHTEVISDEELFREYSRNRVYLGVTFSF